MLQRFVSEIIGLPLLVVAVVRRPFVLLFLHCGIEILSKNIHCGGLFSIYPVHIYVYTIYKR